MRKKYSIQVNKNNHTLGQTTWIMGVLNVTPDSFSDGGLYLDKDKAVQRGLEIAANGADIVDVGGESTRPGSDPISIEEEMMRVIPVISGLRKESDVLISVDTTKSKIAEAALDSGADIINDISSFQIDPQMASLASRKEVPVVLMHMKGIPKTMQIDPAYTDLLGEVKSFLKKKINIALSSGIKKEKIIIDPGIGFGKSYKDNLMLINNLSVLEDLGCPILVGPSRKSFIGKILDMPPDNRIEGTIASAIISIMRGAHIVRIHDVASIKKAILVAEAILENEASTTTLKEKKESYVC